MMRRLAIDDKQMGKDSTNQYHNGLNDYQAGYSTVIPKNPLQVFAQFIIKKILCILSIITRERVYS
jgi:hypothetical protein